MLQGRWLVCAYTVVSLFFMEAASAADPDEMTGRLVKVIDGNTLEFANEANEIYKIILFGIDCPELDQEFGNDARLVLEKMLSDKRLTIILKGKDRWGTRLGIVLINGKTDPRNELLKDGLAWTSEHNPIPGFEELKEKAREKKKGLWSMQNPIPPWIFRRQQTMLKPKSS